MNKYANQYFLELNKKIASGPSEYLNRLGQSIKKTVGDYKPFNQGDANTTGAALGAGLGAVAGGGIGALSGLVSDPGYDEQGQRKSRIKASLRAMIGGGAAGAAGGALGAVALPTLGRGLTDIDTAIRKKMTPSTLIDRLFTRPLIGLQGKMNKAILPRVPLKNMF